MHVTNLDDAGAGSLRAACQQIGARYVVFDVEGIIPLQSPLTLSNPYLTIDGSSAPGEGISTTQYEIEVATHDVILYNLRVRKGPGGVYDCVDILASASNVVLRNMSLHWSVDELLGLSGQNISIEYCILAHPLNITADSPPTGHGFAVLQDTYGNVTMHHCLIAHSKDRNLAIVAGNVQLVNNVVYNYGAGGGTDMRPFADGAQNQVGPLHVDFIGNTYKAGINTVAGFDSAINVFEDSYHGASPGAEFVADSTLYLSGNRDPQRTSDAQPETDCVNSDYEGGIAFALLDAPHAGWPVVTATDAPTAYADVLANAGAFPRDAYDTAIVDEVTNGTGGIIDDPSEA